MKNILIQFGAFNPIHLEHINNIFKARKYFNKNLDAYLSPVSNQYIKKAKNSKIINHDKRVKMLEIALKPEYNIKLLDYEMNKKMMPTIHALEYYYEKFKKEKANIIIIMGDDNIPLLKKWVRCKEIFNYSSILFIPRTYINEIKLINNYKEYEKEYEKLNDKIKEKKVVIRSGVSSSMIKKDIDKNKKN